jgi:dTDP-4-dehydrorhamnose 3,5-epimerase
MKEENRLKFVPLEIEGSYGIINKQISDGRGSIIRLWEDNSLLTGFSLTEASLVTNPVAGTLRGIHYQKKPFDENKIVECVQGRIFDVIVDLRRNSKNATRKIEIEIGPQCTYQGLVIPKGCAHGYLTMEPQSNLVYFMDNIYSPENSCGIVWNDVQIGINWPSKPVLISEQDLNWPGLNE